MGQVKVPGDNGENAPFSVSGCDVKKLELTHTSKRFETDTVYNILYHFKVPFSDIVDKGALFGWFVISRHNVDSKYGVFPTVRLVPFALFSYNGSVTVNQMPIAGVGDFGFVDEHVFHNNYYGITCNVSAAAGTLCTVIYDQNNNSVSVGSDTWSGDRAGEICDAILICRK